MTDNVQLSRQALRDHEQRILIGLVDFYYEAGYASDAYRDETTGGIYEHKLANRIGYATGPQGGSPPEFLEACRILEANGYVRRLTRKEGFPELGIWPTPSGLDRAEYLKRSLFGKALAQLQRRWPEILAAVVTTMVTLAVSWFLGLFGLGR